MSPPCQNKGRSKGLLCGLTCVIGISAATSTSFLFLFLQHTVGIGLCPHPGTQTFHQVIKNRNIRRLLVLPGGGQFYWSLNITVIVVSIVRAHVCEHVSSALSMCSSLSFTCFSLQTVWRQKTGDARHLFSCKQTHKKTLFLNREAFRERLGWKNSKAKLYQPVHLFSSIKTAAELLSLFDTTGRFSEIL